MMETPLMVPQPPGPTVRPAAREGHRSPQPVRSTIVAMCRADHADQAMDMSTFGNSGELAATIG